ncbi:hypothetical protein AYO44_02705 [Planctomycetaceae bacterium SCGC AG-212-F19]|nr:hypothetical protein AYO44_02705 [Planctomycetaceae bacterium SCGC AG-212-F19]
MSNRTEHATNTLGEEDGDMAANMIFLKSREPGEAAVRGETTFFGENSFARRHFILSAPAGMFK